ncbi:UDP-glycosyltransferase 71K1-like [Macadamia integrifolia]|uniref:UDP-glycosyltransferase 71K1-like n=1 Tax=Macadamia integrifolia TaxID=60698 RepID=UPI001C53233E|nr:UDP-glycosyltransferase 71K1-like [Macadamia integrifolia]
MTKKASLVFVPAPAVGHIVSAIELAKLLIARDDRLSIIILLMKTPYSPTFNTFLKSLAASVVVTGIRFVELPQLEPPSPEMAQSIEGSVSIFIDNHKPFVKDAITQLFFTSESQTQSPLAGLVIDLFCTSMIDVANELGIPSYLFFSSTAGLLSLMLHLPILDTQIHTDFKDSDIELLIPGFVNSVPPHVLPMPIWCKGQDGYTWYLYHSRRFSETKGIIVNTFSELEPHLISFLSSSSGRTPPVYPVGPLLDLRGQIHSQLDQTNFERINRWLDDQPPSSVVLLCFGSGGSFGVPQVMEIAHGVERSGHRFLWSLRQPSIGFNSPSDYTNVKEVLPEGFLDRTAERGLVCGWIPQVDVLGHRSIGGFVSHCGWNSTLESIWFGVPIACWPLYAEQHLNAFEMVKEMGGLMVELTLDNRGGGDDLVKAEEVERAVRRLMDPKCEVRMRIKEMQEKSRKALMDGGSSFTSLGCLIKDILDECVEKMEGS